MTILRDYKIIEDIKVFESEVPENHPDFDASTLDEIFEKEEKHFWFIKRKKIILRIIRNFINSEQKIIEIGAGTGNIAKYLFENGYKNISVGDMHFKGLKYAKQYGISECYQFNVLDSPFENEFEAVCLFDVLEHISDEDLALKNIHKMLKFNGKIILTVPAHIWLWNKMDDILGHKRRYNKSQLIYKLTKNKFKILWARYFFKSIVPLLFLRKFVYSNNLVKLKKANFEISPLMNNILSLITEIEYRIDKFLPDLFGGSLIVVGEKE